MAEEWSDRDVGNFIDAMVDDFLEFGPEAVVASREQHPEIYFQVIAEILCVFQERQTRTALVN